MKLGVGGPAFPLEPLSDAGLRKGDVHSQTFLDAMKLRTAEVAPEGRVELVGWRSGATCTTPVAQQRQARGLRPTAAM